MICSEDDERQEEAKERTRAGMPLASSKMEEMASEESLERMSSWKQ